MHQPFGATDGTLSRNPCHDYANQNEPDETNTAATATRWARACGTPQIHLHGSPSANKRWTSSSVSGGSRLWVSSLKRVEVINPIRSSLNCNDVLRTPSP